MATSIPGGRAFAAVLIAAFTATTGPAGPAIVGANTQALGPASRDFAFLNLVKQAPPFGDPFDPFDTAGAPPLDADGWPADDFGLVLFTGMQGVSGLGGSYRIEFDAGALPVVQAFESPGRVRSVIRDPISGRVTVAYDFPNGGDQLALGVFFTGGGARNISAIKVATNTDATFSDTYIDHVARFDTLRAGAWSAVNDHPVADWSQRAAPGEPRFTTARGAPWEAIIALANSAGSNLWVNVPHMADDTYVRELARLIRDQLDPALAVYVEYSSEVWNPAYAQRQWNLDRAADEVNAGAVPLDYDGSSDPEVWAARRLGAQAVRLGGIFEQEFGAGSLGTRVRPVIAARTDRAWQFVEAMRYIEAVHGEPSAFVFGVAAAPIMDMQGLDADPTLTPDEVLAALEFGLERWAGSQDLEIVASQAAYFGVEMLASSAGADTAGPNNIDAKREAALSPGMGSLAADSVRAWAADGGGVLVWSVAGAGSYATDAGTFPLTEDLNGPEIPKLQAIDVVQAEPMPPVSAGIEAPAVLDARRHTLRAPGWDTASDALDSIDAGDTFEYLVRADAPTRVRVLVRAGSVSGGERLGVSINDADDAVMTCATTGSPGAFDAASGGFLADLEPGLSTVRVRAIDGGPFAIESVSLACLADLDGDGWIDLDDLDRFVVAFLGATAAGDQDGDGDTDNDDLQSFVDAFLSGCG
ncbi:MAG: hypothetical protein RIB60_11040 [Phycisphaerales bacterium]